MDDLRDTMDLFAIGSRLTSLELITLGVPSVMICDTMVGSLFQHHNIHAVVIGADRIAKNGDTANKVCLRAFLGFAFLADGVFGSIDRVLQRCCTCGKA